ncbi:MAG: alpha/beta fold hydrolase [Chloroflexi bacterium]|nr:alpha/beta fold hydrolase [Chloroflexota bacterium]
MQRQVNGTTLAYDRVGQGRCIVLCHSLGMNREIWFQQVPVFSQRHQVLTYDARGHGQSSKPPGPYALEQFAQDVYALLQADGIDRAAVVGLSLGGNIAQALAVAHPELVQALVLSDTTAYYGDEQAWEQRARDVEARGLAAIVDTQLGRWLSDGFRASHPELMARFATWLTANDVRTYTACQRMLGKIDLRGQVERLACPTLVVVGEADPATPLPMARDLQQRIAGARLVVLPGARHMSPIEYPEQFNAAVLDFLAQAGW